MPSKDGWDARGKRLADTHDTSGKGRRKQPVAVALEYEPEGDKAPVVVASGRGTLAEQILQIAFAHGIKVREDASLAELLSLIDIDTEIPVEAFAAVAEILIYVYRANGTMPDFLKDAQPQGTP